MKIITAISYALFGLFVTAAFTSPAIAVELPEDMRPNMQPYADGLPSHPFATPGTKIDSSNVDQAKDVLVPMLYQMVKDGWVDIVVTETTPVPQNESLILVR